MMAAVHLFMSLCMDLDQIFRLDQDFEHHHIDHPGINFCHLRCLSHCWT